MGTCKQGSYSHYAQIWSKISTPATSLKISRQSESNMQILMERKGNEIRIMPKYGPKNLLMLETWKLAWELWFAIGFRNFYFKTLSQSKGSYQLLIKFMLLFLAFIKNLSGEVQIFPADNLDNFLVPLGPFFF